MAKIVINPPERERKREITIFVVEEYGINEGGAYMRSNWKFIEKKKERKSKKMEMNLEEE